MLSFARAQYNLPADSLATNETRWLYGSMQRLSGAGIMFGHHDDTAYGVHFKLKDSSDVHNVTGAYPAVYGWDLSGIELDSLWDINQIPFKTQARLVREAYERGGINTFCWHMNNPVTLKTSWDTSGIYLKQLLPGGSHHEMYRTWLDRAAKYLSSLKGKDGEAIPILFRPFHELTGNWFWWGTDNATADDFVALWQFTVNYLRNNRKLHNLLMVYSTADYYSDWEMMGRYPGDEYVDVIGFDRYQLDTTAQYNYHMKRQLELLQQQADEHHKIASIAETGYQGIPDSTWWTKQLLPLLSTYNKISYLLIWRNNGPEHYYAPFPGQGTAEDFKQFYKSNNIIFNDRLTPLAVYGPQHLQRYNQKLVQKE
ncbi:glycoside hydrolase family 26 protein [Mucilaginibacter terrae]|uniref:Mannan endo-1,4-beta-mannosidase n=1 Tax=Mucilaginibacter terrae TaxID=1955052 RepID=A0ABU3GTZ7_9SPHI|nr:glycosyl hydrolase [Mucilaginibacter terrae]MDT3402442.1 mannan endo-1,4-beta-mannosidase [Mucilaginibacter terrae]